MTTSGHRVLVVEDEAFARDEVCAVLRSRGDVPRAVATVEEALAAIEEEEFCYFVLDQQLPVDAREQAFVSGGQRVILAARKSDLRRTAEGSVTPIVALTGYSDKPRFVSGLFELGIDAFVEKPLNETLEYFLEKTRSVLARAGRSEHAQCAALARRGAVAPVISEAPASTVRLALRGKVTKSGRTEIEINGVKRELQDSRFAALLRCVVAHERSVEAWSSREALGIGASKNATTHIRDAFDGLVPEGFQVIEGDRRGNVRLNPALVVDAVDWDALAAHPDAGVARTADERRKRRERR